MEDRVSDWKFRRAVVRRDVVLPPDHDARPLLEEGRKHRHEGYAWFVDGFDAWEPDAIVAELAKVGVEVDLEWFRREAPKFPGPYELADVWSQRLRLRDPRDSQMPWLAARALWARLLPDVPSIETEADALERAIYDYDKARKEQGANPDPLPVLERIAAATEGDGDLGDAITDELPIPLWRWVLSAFRRAARVEEPERWRAVAGPLGRAAQATGVFELALAGWRLASTSPSGTMGGGACRPNRPAGRARRQRLSGAGPPGRASRR